MHHISERRALKRAPFAIIGLFGALGVAPAAFGGCSSSSSSSSNNDVAGGAGESAVGGGAPTAGVSAGAAAGSGSTAGGSTASGGNGAAGGEPIAGSSAAAGTSDGGASGAAGESCPGVEPPKFNPSMRSNQVKCSDAGSVCTYGTDCCSCNRYAACGADPFWYCVGVQTGCPLQPPSVGDSCSNPGLSCTYCDNAGTWFQLCNAGKWAGRNALGCT